MYDRNYIFLSCMEPQIMMTDVYNIYNVCVCMYMYTTCKAECQKIFFLNIFKKYNYKVP